MTMLPGQQLGADHSKISSRVLFEVGALLACMHHTLQECDSQHLETDPTHPWAIENIHLLSDYLHCIQENEERMMLSGIISKFQQIRRDKFHKLQKGLIHGDFHDYNLIVDWESSTASPSSPPPTPSFPDSQHGHILQKYGIIDFEEMSLSYPALELARLIADMMIDCHQVPLFEIGGHVLAGYASVDRMPMEQFGLCFYDAAQACLAQFVVLSIYEYQSHDELNEYCLLSTEDSRALLSKLRTVDAGEVYSAWEDVLSGYGMEKVFPRNSLEEG